MEKKHIPIFVIDSGVMVGILKGKDMENKMMVMMNNMTNKGMPFKALAPLSSFLRALWMMKEDIKPEYIKKLLGNIEIINTPPIDFTNEEAVRNQIVEVAQIFSGTFKKQKPLVAGG